MTKHSKGIPEGLHTLTPYLIIKNAAKAIDFYQRAFHAQELYCQKMPDGKVMHAKLQIGDSIIMVSDEFPQSAQCGMKSPSTLNGSAVVLHLYVEDVDSAFEQAVKAGAKVTMPLENTFWGDRYGQIEDPCGHHWSIATKVEQLTEEEVSARAKKCFGACSHSH